MTVRSVGTRRWARNLARAGAIVSAIMLALSTWSVLTASAAGTDAGDAQVVDPTTSQPLASGGSSTDFTLKLPQDAACTGDSATGQYKVQSYMVMSSVDPGTLQYGSAGPQPTATGANFREPLYDTNGTPYVNQQTANATTAGGPGPVINIPTFNFEVYQPGNIPAGTYNVGISCTLGPPSSTQVDKFWIVQFVVTTDPADSPAQIKWTAQAAPAQATTTTTSGSNGSTTTTAQAGATTTTPSGTGATTTTVATAGDQATNTTSPSAVLGSGTGSDSGGGSDPGSPAGSSSGSSGSPLASTGSSPAALLVWGVLLAIFGRMAVLLGRPLRVRREGPATSHEDR